MPRPRESLERLRFAAIAMLVSVFPERSKGTGWAAAYASVAAHVVSGWVEAVVAVSVFVLGLLSYADRFNATVGWKYVSNKPTLTYGDFFGAGVIGYLSFLLTPLAWITIWCFGEGIVRALDAAISGRLLGVAMVALPWRAARALARRGARARRLALLGPERPDEIVPQEPGARSALAVYASREKEWPVNQGIEYGGEYVEGVKRRIVKRGAHSAIRYDFRRLDHGQVIRGTVVRYTLESAPARELEPVRAGDRSPG